MALSCENYQERNNTKKSWRAGERDFPIETNNKIKAEKCEAIFVTLLPKFQFISDVSKLLGLGRLVSSDRTPDCCCAGGRGFEPQTRATLRRISVLAFLENLKTMFSL